jgi:hypothetical protein
MDLFVVPTISFKLLYGLLILKHGRREIIYLSATAHPSAEWISRQLTEAYGWEEGPRYLIRDRDSAYGEKFTRRLWAMGIRDRPTTPRSPWQNGYCERLIGSIRRECLDHVVILGAAHLQRILRAYAHYNNLRTHRSLDKDAPRLRSGWAHHITGRRRRTSPSIRASLSFRYRQHLWAKSRHDRSHSSTLAIKQEKRIRQRPPIVIAPLIVAALRRIASLVVPIVP